MLLLVSLELLKSNL